MNVFFAWIFGFVFSGFLLAKYCPEPGTLDAATQAARELALAGQGPMPEVYAQAHYLWYAYCGVGFISLVALLIFIGVTKRLDRGKEAVS